MLKANAKSKHVLDPIRYAFESEKQHVRKHLHEWIKIFKKFLFQATKIITEERECSYNISQNHRPMKSLGWEETLENLLVQHSAKADFPGLHPRGF